MPVSADLFGVAAQRFVPGAHSAFRRFVSVGLEHGLTLGAGGCPVTWWVTSPTGSEHTVAFRPGSAAAGGAHMAGFVTRHRGVWYFYHVSNSAAN